MELSSGYTLLAYNLNTQQYQKNKFKEYLNIWYRKCSSWDEGMQILTKMILKNNLILHHIEIMCQFPTKNKEKYQLFNKNAISTCHEEVMTRNMFYIYYSSELKQ